mmetsp:Transcript_2678/g.6390  ORF Transcript_2678/g.6390 Transcript_2678/m.6390 type:complete len:262 (+) Transcript_2678:64-849(+)
MEEERYCDDKVGSQQHCTLEPVGLAVAGDRVDNEDGENENNRLKHLEVQVEWLAHHPSNQNKQRDDRECNLSRRADSHTKSKLHLVFPSDSDGGHVLCNVAHNREDNQTNEALWQVQVHCRGLNTVDEQLRFHRHNHCGNREQDERADNRQRGSLGLFLFVRLAVLLLVQVCVRLELKYKEQHIDREEHDCSETRDLQQLRLVVRSDSERSWHTYSEHNHQQQRRVGSSGNVVEHLHLVPDSSEKKGASKHQEKVSQDAPQ